MPPGGGTLFYSGIARQSTILFSDWLQTFDSEGRSVGSSATSSAQSRDSAKSRGHSPEVGEDDGDGDGIPVVHDEQDQLDFGLNTLWCLTQFGEDRYTYSPVLRALRLKWGAFSFFQSLMSSVCPLSVLGRTPETWFLGSSGNFEQLLFLGILFFSTFFLPQNFF